jgi:hypothetical protein
MSLSNAFVKVSPLLADTYMYARLDVAIVTYTKQKLCGGQAITGTIKKPYSKTEYQN